MATPLALFLLILVMSIENVSRRTRRKISKKDMRMVWIRVTRVMAETVVRQESVLLNTANLMSIEQVQDTVYVYLRDGRHFAITEPIETLAAALVPITDQLPVRAVSASQEHPGTHIAPSSSGYDYKVPPQHILVPLDCRVSTRHVLDYALTLAGQLQARLTLLHVLEMPALTDTAEGSSSPPLQHVSVSVAAYIHQAEAEKRRTLDTYTQQAHQAGLQCDAMLVHGIPFQQILELIPTKEVDLILMGTQGRTGLRHMFLGSVAEKVVRLAECPVLVVHGEEVQ